MKPKNKSKTVQVIVRDPRTGVQDMRQFLLEDYFERDWNYVMSEMIKLLTKGDEF